MLSFQQWTSEAYESIDATSTIATGPKVHSTDKSQDDSTSAFHEALEEKTIWDHNHQMPQHSMIKHLSPQVMYITDVFL